MDIQNAEKKLREAQFFLTKMSAQQRLAFGDKEPFDFYLSAFLSAGMSVRDRFRYKQDRTRNDMIKAWRKNWEDHLCPGDKAIFHFMCKDRVAEVHHSGSSRSQKSAKTEIFGDSYSDASGTLNVIAPPGTPPSVIFKNAYYFIVAGTERQVTEVCAEYLALLNRMLTTVKAEPFFKA